MATVYFVSGVKIKVSDVTGMQKWFKLIGRDNFYLVGNDYAFFFLWYGWLKKGRKALYQKLTSFKWSSLSWAFKSDIGCLHGKWDCWHFVCSIVVYWCYQQFLLKVIQTVWNIAIGHDVKSNMLFQFLPL